MGGELAGGEVPSARPGPTPERIQTQNQHRRGILGGWELDRPAPVTLRRFHPAQRSFCSSERRANGSDDRRTRSASPEVIRTVSRPKRRLPSRKRTESPPRCPPFGRWDQPKRQYPSQSPESGPSKATDPPNSPLDARLWPVGPTRAALPQPIPRERALCGPPAPVSPSMPVFRPARPPGRHHPRPAINRSSEHRHGKGRAPLGTRPLPFLGCSTSPRRLLRPPRACPSPRLLALC
jgi:hypothetical protein